MLIPWFRMDLVTQVQGLFLWTVDEAGSPNHMSHVQTEGNLRYFPLPSLVPCLTHSQ